MKKMENVALNNLPLDHLTSMHPKLSRGFYGTVPWHRLPRALPEEGGTAYIVNKDPHDRPGKHWIALLTYDNVCEFLDSYGLSLEVYGITHPPRRVVGSSFQVPDA